MYQKRTCFVHKRSLRSFSLLLIRIFVSLRASATRLPMALVNGAWQAWQFRHTSTGSESFPLVSRVSPNTSRSWQILSLYRELCSSHLMKSTPRWQSQLVNLQLQLQDIIYFAVFILIAHLHQCVVTNVTNALVGHQSHQCDVINVTNALARHQSYQLQHTKSSLTPTYSF